MNLVRSSVYLQALTETSLGNRTHLDFRTLGYIGLIIISTGNLEDKLKVAQEYIYKFPQNKMILFVLSGHGLVSPLPRS